MRYYCLLLIMLSTMGWGQVTTYNLNNDTATHGFSLPLPCPSTTGGNCHDSGSQSNQAAVGANSIWAECALSGASSFHNPECSGGGELAASSSSAAAANSQYVHIVRVTDGTTLNNNPEVNFTGSTGGAGDVMFDSSATRVMILNAVANVLIPFSFDPNPADTSTYMQVTKLYGSSYYVNSTTSAFSKITPKLWYTVQKSDNVTGLVGTGGVLTNQWVILSYDFTS